MTSTPLPHLALLSMALFACDPQPVDDDGPVDKTVTLAPPARGAQLVTPVYEVPPYSEVEICSVVRLDSDAAALYWTNRLESLVSEGTHHMNVLIGPFSFLDAFLDQGAAEAALGATVGQYPCGELSTMEQAFPVFPSQRENQQITFPEGVAAPMPAPLVLVFSHHYVNVGDRPVLINAALNIEAIPPEQVEQVAGLVFDDIRDIEVAGGRREVSQRTCVTDRDVQLALVSTHTHEWAECTTLNRYDGQTEQVEPEPFFVNKLWDQPPILHFEQGAMSLAAGDGVHWACHYRNDQGEVLINDGTAEGEMCVFAAVVYPSLWSVQDVQQAFDSGDLGQLNALLGEAMGPCDDTIDGLPSPWESEPQGVGQSDPACEDLQQTASNTLED